MNIKDYLLRLFEKGKTEVKCFIPTNGPYYHFITESALGLYLLLKKNAKLESLDCQLWYQGKFVEIVQMFSAQPVVQIPLEERLKDAKRIDSSIKTLKIGYLKRRRDFYKLLPLAKFLSDRIPEHYAEKGITIIKRANKREYAQTEELAQKLIKFQLPVRIVQFEKMPFAEQVNVARNTSILIAPHGAGTINQMFMRKGAKLIELFPKGYYNWRSEAVAKVFGHELVEIESDQPGTFGRQPSEEIKRLIE